jgi:hypothetical protein
MLSGVLYYHCPILSQLYRLRGPCGFARRDKNLLPRNPYRAASASKSRYPPLPACAHNSRAVSRYSFAEAFVETARSGCCGQSQRGTANRSTTSREPHLGIASAFSRRERGEGSAAGPGSFPRRSTPARASHTSKPPPKVSAAHGEQYGTLKQGVQCPMARRMK